MRTTLKGVIGALCLLGSHAHALEDATAWGINTRIEMGYMCKKKCAPEDLLEKRVTLVTVVEIACGGPADVAGLRVGDSIVAINSTRIFGLPFGEYQNLRGGTSAVSVEPVRLTIERGEKSRLERLFATITPSVLARPITWTCGT